MVSPKDSPSYFPITPITKCLHGETIGETIGETFGETFAQGLPILFAFIQGLSGHFWGDGGVFFVITS